MTRRIISTSAFSLIEALVAGIVFSIAVAGVFASLSSSKKPVVDSDKSLAAARCGEQFLESLRASVDARDWTDSSSKLAIKPLGTDAGTCVVDGITYSMTYQIEQAGTGSLAQDPRKATVSVSWP